MLFVLLYDCMPFDLIPVFKYSEIYKVFVGLSCECLQTESLKQLIIKIIVNLVICIDVTEDTGKRRV